MYTIEKCVLNKKWNINSAPNDASIPRMYVQDVGNNVPITNVPQTPLVVNTDVVELPVVDNSSQVQELPVVGQETNTDDVVVHHDTSANNDNETLSIKEQIKKYSDEIDAMQPVFDDEVYIENKGKTKNKEWILSLFEKLGFKVSRNDIGDIVVDKKRISKSLRYLSSEGELAAYSALPYVLKSGKKVPGHSNHKHRGYATETIVAPVVINGVRGNMGVAVISDEHGNFYRVHRILMPDGSAFVYKNNGINTERAGATIIDDIVTSPADVDSTTTIPQTPPVVKPDVIELPVVDNSSQMQELPVVDGSAMTSILSETTDFEKVIADYVETNISEIEEDIKRFDHFKNVFAGTRRGFVRMLSGGTYEIGTEAATRTGAFVPNENIQRFDSLEEAVYAQYKYMLENSDGDISRTIQKHLDSYNKRHGKNASLKSPAENDIIEKISFNEEVAGDEVHARGNISEDGDKFNERETSRAPGTVLQRRNRVDTVGRRTLQTERSGYRTVEERPIQGVTGTDGFRKLSATVVNELPRKKIKTYTRGIEPMRSFRRRQGCMRRL